MRSHGLPSFPAPQVVTTGGEHGIRQALPPSVAESPAFGAARRACAGILPPPGADGVQTPQALHQQELGLLSFARCMRSRGVTGFPDPDAQGQITSERLATAGIDVHAHSVIDAAVTCVPASHGFVSKASIANAVSQGG